MFLIGFLVTKKYFFFSLSTKLLLFYKMLNLRGKLYSYFFSTFTAILQTFISNVKNIIINIINFLFDLCQISKAYNK
jgi:hypothetical protein